MKHEEYNTIYYIGAQFLETILGKPQKKNLSGPARSYPQLLVAGPLKKSFFFGFPKMVSKSWVPKYYIILYSKKKKKYCH